MYRTIEKHADETGYTPKALRRKIERGDFVAGREFTKAPDGRVLIIVKGFEKWVQRGQSA